LIKSREGFGKEKYETEEFQKKVRNNFKRFENYSYWNVIDALRDKEVVHKEIVAKVEGLLENYYKEGVEELVKNYYPGKIGEDLFTSEKF
jgi:hypothetical protein